MLPPIRIDLADILPEEHERAAGLLNDLHPGGDGRVDARHSRRETAVGQIVRILLPVRAEGGLVGIEFSLGPGSHGKVFAAKRVIPPTPVIIAVNAFPSVADGRARSPGARQIVDRV